MWGALTHMRENHVLVHTSLDAIQPAHEVVGWRGIAGGRHSIIFTIGQLLTIYAVVCNFTVNCVLENVGTAKNGCVWCVTKNKYYTNNALMVTCEQRPKSLVLRAIRTKPHHEDRVMGKCGKQWVLKCSRCMKLTCFTCCCISVSNSSKCKLLPFKGFRVYLRFFSSFGNFAIPLTWLLPKVILDKILTSYIGSLLNFNGALEVFKCMNLWIWMIKICNFIPILDFMTKENVRDSTEVQTYFSYKRYWLLWIDG